MVAMPNTPVSQHQSGYDISCADGGGQSSGQSRKLADITVGIRVPGDGQTDACEGPALDKSGSEGEKEMGSEEKADHGNAPEAVVDAFHNAAYQFHNDTSFPRGRSIL